MRLFFHKLTHWEYWPFAVVYFPVFFLWAYYSLRAKTVFFFNAANPGMQNGGFMSESKKQIYDMLPAELYPKTILISANDVFDQVLKRKEATGIQYPLIAKPDIGLRGSGVRKINSDEMLRNYCLRAKFDFVIQDMINYPKEIGIFYVRDPRLDRGQITGIVSKEFIIVSGDGKSTVKELLMKDPRHHMQLSNIAREHSDVLNTILPLGKKINLMPYGNHARGAKFTDVSHLISDGLISSINQICLKIPGFFFGRLDIMYDDFTDLEAGRNFSIVEVNGSSSEPTHIYDPKHSIFFAWKELIRHIRYMYEISSENHRRGTRFLSNKEGMEQYRIHLHQSRQIANF